jgi:hypothetical protein
VRASYGRGLADRAGDLRKVLSDARTVCQRLGLDEGSRPQARGVLIRCPWHADRTPSCSVREGSDGTLAVRCFGCGRTGDVFHLVGAANGIDDIGREFAEVLRLAAELAGAPITESAWTFRRRTPESESSYPPAEEVVTLWLGCRSVLDDTEVSRWLSSRALDAADVDLLGLARALPLGLALPRWARFQRRTWAEAGYRAIVPMFDETGAVRSLRARRVVDGSDPKAIPPTGFRTGGLVMADGLGRALLASGKRPDFWPQALPLRIVIAEGEPDFLTWGTAFSDGDETAPAVIGVVSGSWNARIAERVPDGSRVIVWTDHDLAGEKYAVSIRETLSTRCTVLRARSQDCSLCPDYGWTGCAA